MARAHSLYKAVFGNSAWRGANAPLLLACAALLNACGGGASEPGAGGGGAAIACIMGPGPSAMLAWDAVAGAAGYNIYSSVGSGNFALLQDPGNSTILTVNGLISGMTYYFAATAYDSSNNESGFSNVVCKTVS